MMSLTRFGLIRLDSTHNYFTIQLTSTLKLFQVPDQWKVVFAHFQVSPALPSGSH